MPYPENSEGDEEKLDLEKEAENEAMQDLQGKSPEEIIRQGHAALIKRLVAKVEAGTASHQEMAILRNLLRDNGMYLGLPPEGAVRSDQPRNTPTDLPSFEDGDKYN